MVWVLVATGKAEGITETEVDDSEGGLMMLQLIWVQAGFVWTELSIVVCKTVARVFVWVPEVE